MHILEFSPLTIASTFFAISINVLSQFSKSPHPRTPSFTVRAPDLKFAYLPLLLLVGKVQNIRGETMRASFTGRVEAPVEAGLAKMLSATGYDCRLPLYQSANDADVLLRDFVEVFVVIPSRGRGLLMVLVVASWEPPVL